MLPCNKRQTIVKRPEGLTVFRCVNNKCGLKGQEVDVGICSRCEVRSHREPPACRKRSRDLPATAPSNIEEREVLDISDADVKEMIVDAGFDTADFDASPVMPDSPDYPAMGTQLHNYKEALIKWNKAGRPTRTAEEVEHIHKTHCSRCDWYDPEQKRCRGCGCKVTVGSIAIFNKLKMATEHCPKEQF